MAKTLHTDTASADQTAAGSTRAIWIAIVALVVVLAGSVALFGLAGLVVVMVPAALGMVVLLVRLVTDGM